MHADTTAPTPHRENRWVAFDLRPDHQGVAYLAECLASSIYPHWEQNCEAAEVAMVMTTPEQRRTLGPNGLAVLIALIYHMGLNVRGRAGTLTGKFLCDTGREKLAEPAGCDRSTVTRALRKLYQLGLLYYFQRRKRQVAADGTVTWKCHTNLYTVGPQAVRSFWSKKRKPLHSIQAKNRRTRTRMTLQAEERLLAEAERDMAVRRQICFNEAAKRVREQDPDYLIPEAERVALYDRYEAEGFVKNGIPPRETPCSARVRCTIPSSKEEAVGGPYVPPARKTMAEIFQAAQAVRDRLVAEQSGAQRVSS